MNLSLSVPTKRCLVLSIASACALAMPCLPAQGQPAVGNQVLAAHERLDDALDSYIQASYADMGNLLNAIQNAPKQQDILKDAALNHLFSLPKEAADFTLHHFGMSDFNLLVNEHEKFEKGQKTQSPFNIFAANLPRLLKPKPVNTWDFINHDTQMAGLINERWGLCAGFTFVLRRMHLLAYYQPSAKVGIDPDKDPEGWLQEMKKRLDRIILDRTATVIPEFKNLAHLNSNKALSLYLKKLVIREWAMRSASLGALQQLMQTRATFTTEDAERIYQDIHFRLNQLKYPPVVSAAGSFKQRGSWWIHVLTVIGLSGDPKSDFTIHVWDPNFDDYTEVAGIIRIYKLANGHWRATFGKDAAQLSDVMLHPYDDFEITDMVKNSLDFCAKNRPLCTRVTR